MKIALWTRLAGDWHRLSPDALFRLGIAYGDGADPSPQAIAWDALASGYEGAAVTSPDCEQGAVAAAWYLGMPDARSGVLAVAGGRAGVAR